MPVSMTLTSYPYLSPISWTPAHPLSLKDISPSCVAINTILPPSLALSSAFVSSAAFVSSDFAVSAAFVSSALAVSAGLLPPQPAREETVSAIAIPNAKIFFM